MVDVICEGLWSQLKAILDERYHGYRPTCVPSSDRVAIAHRTRRRISNVKEQEAQLANRLRQHEECEAPVQPQQQPAAGRQLPLADHAECVGQQQHEAAGALHGLPAALLQRTTAKDEDLTNREVELHRLSAKLEEKERALERAKLQLVQQCSQLAQSQCAFDTRVKQYREDVARLLEVLPQLAAVHNLQHPSLLPTAAAAGVEAAPVAAAPTGAATTPAAAPAAPAAPAAAWAGAGPSTCVLPPTVDATESKADGLVFSDAPYPWTGLAAGCQPNAPPEPPLESAPSPLVLGNPSPSPTAMHQHLAAVHPTSAAAAPHQPACASTPPLLPPTVPPSINTLTLILAVAPAPAPAQPLAPGALVGAALGSAAGCATAAAAAPPSTGGLAALAMTTAQAAAGASSGQAADGHTEVQVAGGPSPAAPAAAPPSAAPQPPTAAPPPRPPPQEAAVAPACPQPGHDVQQPCSLHAEPQSEQSGGPWETAQHADAAGAAGRGCAAQAAARSSTTGQRMAWTRGLRKRAAELGTAEQVWLHAALGKLWRQLGGDGGGGERMGEAAANEGALGRWLDQVEGQVGPEGLERGMEGHVEQLLGWLTCGVPLQDSTKQLLASLAPVDAHAAAVDHQEQQELQQQKELDSPVRAPAAQQSAEEVREGWQGQGTRGGAVDDVGEAGCVMQQGGLDGQTMVQQGEGQVATETDGQGQQACLEQVQQAVAAAASKLASAEDWVRFVHGRLQGMRKASALLEDVRRVWEYLVGQGCRAGAAGQGDSQGLEWARGQMVEKLPPLLHNANHGSHWGVQWCQLAFHARKHAKLERQQGRQGQQQHVKVKPKKKQQRVKQRQGRQWDEGAEAERQQQRNAGWGGQEHQRGKRCRGGRVPRGGDRAKRQRTYQEEQRGGDDAGHWGGAGQGRLEGAAPGVDSGGAGQGVLQDGGEQAQAGVGRGQAERGGAGGRLQQAVEGAAARSEWFSSNAAPCKEEEGGAGKREAFGGRQQASSGQATSSSSSWQVGASLGSMIRLSDCAASTRGTRERPPGASPEQPAGPSATTSLSAALPAEGATTCAAHACPFPPTVPGQHRHFLPLQQHEGPGPARLFVEPPPASLQQPLQGARAGGDPLSPGGGPLGAGGGPLSAQLQQASTHLPQAPGMQPDASPLSRHLSDAHPAAAASGTPSSICHGLQQLAEHASSGGPGVDYWALMGGPPISAQHSNHRPPAVKHPRYEPSLPRKQSRQHPGGSSSSTRGHEAAAGQGGGGPGEPGASQPGAGRQGSMMLSAPEGLGHGGAQRSVLVASSYRPGAFRPSVRKRVLQKRWNEHSPEASEEEGGGLDGMVGLLRKEADLAEGEVVGE